MGVRHRPGPVRLGAIRGHRRSRRLPNRQPVAGRLHRCRHLGPDHTAGIARGGLLSQSSERRGCRPDGHDQPFRNTRRPRERGPGVGHNPDRGWRLRHRSGAAYWRRAPRDSSAGAAWTSGDWRRIARGVSDYVRSGRHDRKSGDAHHAWVRGRAARTSTFNCEP